jgi:hypothetical protein
MVIGRTLKMVARSNLLWVAALCVLCSLTACIREFGMILELKDVQFFKAQEISSSPLTIRLSGLAFHSALVVRNITTLHDGDSLQVLVHLMPTMPGRSGSFSYDLAILESINTVSFGEKKTLIWDRSAGFVKPK